MGDPERCAVSDVQISGFIRVSELAGGRVAGVRRHCAPLCNVHIFVLTNG